MSASLNRDELQALYERADARMKASNGHQYVTILKTRCQHCGRSPDQPGRCRGWFETFVSCLTMELIAAGIVRDADTPDDLAKGKAEAWKWICTYFPADADRAVAEGLAERCPTVQPREGQ